MSNITSKLRTKLYIFFLKTPILNRSSKRWYRKLGVKLAENSRIYRGLTVLGSYSNIELGKNAEITTVELLTLLRQKVKHKKLTFVEYEKTKNTLRQGI